jgi:CheY-like chemotaxis protein
LTPTLLLASGSPAVRRVLELAFPAGEVRVTAVSDGHEAIARIGCDPPDIIFAEVSLAERDGYEVATFVRESAHLSRIPVLLLAGVSDAVDEDRAERLGCRGVLQKPLDPHTVLSRVRALLPGRFSTVALDPYPAAGSPMPGAADQPPGSGAPAGGDYLDRLDAAFAAMSASPDPVAQPRTPAPGEPAMTISDAVIDQIAREVIARLGDEQMRREVRDVAERLVREEIDRIKGIARETPRSS